MKLDPTKLIRITRKFGDTYVSLFVPAEIMDTLEEIPVASGKDIQNETVPLNGFLAWYQPCPICGKLHSTWDYPLNWYFVCCGHARLVWRVDNFQLSLEIVEEDQTDLGASDERPLGPDSPLYRKGAE